MQSSTQVWCSAHQNQCFIFHAFASHQPFLNQVDTVFFFYSKWSSHIHPPPWDARVADAYGYNRKMSPWRLANCDASPSNSVHLLWRGLKEKFWRRESCFCLLGWTSSLPRCFKRTEPSAPPTAPTCCPCSDTLGQHVRHNGNTSAATESSFSWKTWIDFESSQQQGASTGSELIRRPL